MTIKPPPGLRRNLRLNCNRLQRAPLEEVLALAARFDCQISTLQLNHPDHVTYRVTMTYTDRTKKAINGWIAPSVFVVNTSPSLREAIIISYASVCMQARKLL